jgi:hypothetical protein
MKNLTYNNHFKFGYNGEYFNLRQSPDDVWNVKYGRCDNEPFDFRTECTIAATKIRESTSLPIYVAMSGGVDSEVVARSFIDASIPITAIIATYDDDGNKHDVRYAIDFCKSRNVPYSIHNLDIIKFWEKDLMKYAKPTKCISPQLPVVMWLSDQMKGSVVLGSGECYMVKNDDNIWELWEKEKIASWYRHFMINNKEGAPGFFQYTPELMLSYLKDKVITELMEKEQDTSTYYTKTKLYNKYWTDISKREIYTGFEDYEDFDYQLYRPMLESKFKGSDGVVKTSYDDLMMQLHPIKCKKISREEMLKYEPYYQKENMTLLRSPYDDIIETRNCFAAYINDQLAGLTCLDRFKGNTGCYVHGAYTFIKFRGQGVNRALWNYKINDNKQYPDMVIHAINPDWLPDASFQKEMLERKGFVHTGNRPDGAPVLTCKLGDLK